MSRNVGRDVSDEKWEESSRTRCAGTYETFEIVLACHFTCLAD